MKRQAEEISSTPPVSPNPASAAMLITTPTSMMGCTPISTRRSSLVSSKSGGSSSTRVRTRHAGGGSRRHLERKKVSRIVNACVQISKFYYEHELNKKDNERNETQLRVLEQMHKYTKLTSDQFNADMVVQTEEQRKLLSHLLVHERFQLNPNDPATGYKHVTPNSSDVDESNDDE